MATYTTNTENHRIFVESPEDKGVKIPISFSNRTLIITTQWGDKVVFTKCSRGNSFHDSRTPKKNISFSEFISEVIRLLDNKEQSDHAIKMIIGNM